MINRDEYVQRMKTQLEQWNAEFAKWEVKSKSREAWVDMMRGTDESWARMREAFDKASSHFRAK